MGPKRTSIGRAPQSDVFLDDITVSRRHAEFYQRGEGYLVKDVGSLNGTYLNRERIDEAELDNGDEVQIGKFKLVYLAGTEESAAEDVTVRLTPERWLSVDYNKMFDGAD